MTGPPATAPSQTVSGGIQTRADGQRIQVRTFEGDLVRIVPSSLAESLIDAGLGDATPNGIRLKLGIRWLPPRLDRPSGHPDLNQMRRQEPDRYSAVWRGTADSHIGKGALGRSLGL